MSHPINLLSFHLISSHLIDPTHSRCCSSSQAIIPKIGGGKGKKNAAGKKKEEEINVDTIDFNKKVLHTSWHPKENIIAIAASNNLFVYCAPPSADLVSDSSGDGGRARADKS